MSLIVDAYQFMMTIKANGYQLNRTDFKEAYRFYQEHQSLLQELAESERCAFAEGAGKGEDQVIYLIPNADYAWVKTNDVLKKETGAKLNRDIALQDFATLTLLLAFYQSTNPTQPALREFLKLTDWAEKVSEEFNHLQKIKENSPSQAEPYPCFSDLATLWEGLQFLKEGDKSQTKKGTRLGRLESLALFLEQEGLIRYDRVDQLIVPTPALKTKTTYLLSQHRGAPLLKKLSLTGEGA